MGDVDKFLAESAPVEERRQDNARAQQNLVGRSSRNISFGSVRVALCRLSVRVALCRLKLLEHEDSGFAKSVRMHATCLRFRSISKMPALKCHILKPMTSCTHSFG